jgi:hypothetical protein
MKYLYKTIFLSLISLSATSDVGDVYFCETIKHYEIAADGEVKSYSSEKFKFKVEANELKIIASPLLIDTSLKYKINYLLKPDKSLPKVAWIDFEFRAETTFSRVEFHYGKKLHFTTSHPKGIRAFIADCDAFE